MQYTSMSTVGCFSLYEAGALLDIILSDNARSGN